MMEVRSRFGGRTPKPRVSRVASIALLVATGLVAMACSSSSSHSSATTVAPTATTAAPTVTTAAAPATGPGTPAPQPLAQTGHLTIAISSKIEAFAGLWMANYFQEFAKENLVVNIQVVPGPTGTVLLSQGKADIQEAGFSASLLNAAKSTGTIKVVTNDHQKDVQQTGFYIQKSLLGPDGKPDPSKIKGATVITGIGGGGWGNPGGYPLYLYLQSIGLKESDVKVLNVTAPGDVLLALEHNQASIGLLLTPTWLSVTPASPIVEIPSTGSFAAGLYLANANFLQQHRDVAEAFFRAIIRTDRTYLQGNYHQNPTVVNAMSTTFGQPASALATAPPLTFDPNLGFDGSTIGVYQAMFREAGVLSYPTDFTADQLLDRSVVTDVLAGK